eukprot:scaffold9675_cov143-Skeletonema_marinoi.AAC.8
MFHRGRCNNRKTQRGGKARIPIEQINGRMKKSSSFYGKRICLDQIWLALMGRSKIDHAEPAFDGADGLIDIRLSV